MGKIEKKALLCTAVRESDFFSILPIFFDRIKKYRKWAKLKKSHFRARPIFSVFGPKMPKISIFMKKSFSNNFSMSNFGQKMFSILLTNTYT